MHVSWEALTAMASLLSSVTVLAAVLVAIRQVRVGAEQVEHLRKATQLEGTMKIFAILGSPEMQKARRFIALELPERLKDPKFRAEVPLLAMSPSMEEHGELAVLRPMEMIGAYVKHGLLDAEIVFDYWGLAIVYGWERLESLGVIAIHREALGAAMWENFEDLYRRGKRWAARDPRRQPDLNEVVADAPVS
ncbi:MAG: hypothetical protein M3169_07870 [Candidatus Eremiobacteraeota bacterium]|nr:hypothetical protein [Candidatus Eremiobacteraeota bacterium]